MNRINYRSLFLFILPILCLITPSVAVSESNKKEGIGTGKGPIVINADSLEIDDKQKVVTFTGHVDAQETEFNMTCQKLLLYYTDKPTDSGSTDGGVKIDKIVATGDVRITRPGGGLATADTASYYHDDEKLVLTGNPRVKQGNDFVEGAKISLFIRENRSIVEGSKDKKVKAVYYPTSEKGVSLGQQP